MRGDGGASKLLERVRRRVGEELSMPPRRCEEHYRHELKYLISYGQKADLNLRLAPLLEQDSHARGGCYMIRSLYFDDYWNTAYQEKVDGVLMRKKYRIRIYDYSDRVIKLERKRKRDSWIYKEDASLTHGQFDRILAGAGMYLLVVVAGAVMIGMLALFYSHQDKGRVYIAVIHYASDAVGDDITRAFGRTKFFVKSKTMRGDHVEMAVEVFCDDKDMTFAERIRAIEGVEDVTLIQYNGEYHG